MLTEEQAREKWCPFARVTGKTPVSGNRYMFDSDYSEKKAFACCIASECMSWRHEMHVERGRDIPLREWIPKPTGRGYCGLAGRPE